MYLGLVGSVCGMQQVEACGHGSWFGNRWDTCEHRSVLDTCVTPVSLWPLITIGKLGVSSFLDMV
jgi:hypothetical protein